MNHYLQNVGGIFDMLDKIGLYYDFSLEKGCKNSVFVSITLYVYSIRTRDVTPD